MSDDEAALWQDYFDSDDLDMPDFAVASPSRSSDASGARAVGSCYGCGVSLQVQQPYELGYVDPDVYAEKRKHRQLNRILCSRCVALSHGEMVPAVEDFLQKQQQLETRSTDAAEPLSTPDEDPHKRYTFKGQMLLTPQQLRDQLKVIRESRSVCVMLFDALDASGSFLSRVRNLIGSNPVIVVATKSDLLPKGTDLERVTRWIHDLVRYKKLNCLSVHLVSNKTGAGIDQACASILSNRLGRDVYIIGAANVGKSAFVRCMLREMADAGSRHFDVQATALRKQLPVESAMPGTTLGLVRLGAFTSGGAIYDTPGLHLHHRMPHLLQPNELKAIHPQRRLRSYVAASPFSIAMEHDMYDEVTGELVPCGTYLWGALLRIDVLEAPDDAQLVFLGTGVIQVYACPLFDENEELHFDESAGQDANDDGALFGMSSVARRGGLKVAREVELKTAGFTTTLADICMSGMPGWVSVVGGTHAGVIRLRVWAPKGVEVHMRPPLPCPTRVNVSKALL